MNTLSKQLDKSLQQIARLRTELAALSYSSKKYDAVEDNMHRLEDDFQRDHGGELKAILKQVHDKHCPDSETLYPISYIARKYTISADNEYSVEPTQGVYVDMDEYPKKDTRLVIVPNPVRVVLNIGRKEQKTLWPESATDPSAKPRKKAAKK